MFHHRPIHFLHLPALYSSSCIILIFYIHSPRSRREREKDVIHFSLGLKSDASGSGSKAFGDDLAHHPSDPSVAKGAQRRHATTGNGH